VYQVVESLCLGCGACAQVCPQGAIAVVDGHASITAERCLECGACAKACPQGAVRQVSPAMVALPAAVPAPEARAKVVTVEAERRTPPALRSLSSWGARLAPLLGSALVWVGREALPNLAAAWRSSPLRAGLQVQCRQHRRGLRKMYRQRRGGR